MDDLPTPKLRAGWVSALLLTLILFFVYYVFMFDFLLQVYKTQFYEISFLNNSTVNVIAYFPKNFFSSGEEWVFINLKNKSGESLYNTQVYLKVSSDNNLVVLLPAIYSGNEADNDGSYNGIDFQIVQPFSTSVSRMAVLAQNTTSIDGVLVRWIDEKGQAHSVELLPEQTIQLGNLNEAISINTFFQDLVRSSIQNSRALKHVFLEIVLLPPWSNGLLFTLVLFSTYLVRDNVETGSDTLPSDPVWWNEVFSIFFASLRVLGIMICIIFLLLALDILIFPPVLGMIVVIRLFLIKRNGIKERFKDQLDFWSFFFVLLAGVWLFRNRQETFLFQISWALLGLVSLSIFLWSRSRSFSTTRENIETEAKEMNRKKTRRG